MKLRPLLLSIAVLVPVAGAVWWFQRPAPATQNADARIGQRVADPSVLAGATKVRIKASGKTLELSRADASATRWILAAASAAEPVLPADSARLSRLAADLVSPKIERLVTSNPTRIATLGLDDSALTFLDAGGKSLLALDLGKNADGGGRFLRYGTEAKAYLARLNTFLDAEATSWRDTALVSELKPEDIASATITLPDTPAQVVVSRPDAKSPWTSPAAPAGHQVKASAVTSQLTNLTGLRYTAFAPVFDPAVVAARILTRDVTLTTFDGRTVKIALGRAPEPPKPAKPATPPAEGATPPPEPTATPRPVYVEITDSKPDATLAAAAKTHAFEVGDWIHTALPAKAADLFEPVPTPPTPAATPAPATPAAPAAKEPISVTTPPLSAPKP
jgi:hypothetical protein